jgi:hypothetical protein
MQLAPRTNIEMAMFLRKTFGLFVDETITHAIQGCLLCRPDNLCKDSLWWDNRHPHNVFTQIYISFPMCSKCSDTWSDWIKDNEF